MKEQENNKTKWLHVRLSEEEYKAINKQFSKTTCRKLSEYTRDKLMEKPLTVYYRNQSLDDFMAEVMRLRTSLNAIGNNFNQVVKKLNAMQYSADVSRWAGSYEQDKKNLLTQVAGINFQIKKMAEQWLQNSIPTHP